MTYDEAGHARKGRHGVPGSSTRKPLPSTAGSASSPVRPPAGPAWIGSVCACVRAQVRTQRRAAWLGRARAAQAGRGRGRGLWPRLAAAADAAASGTAN